MMTSMQAISGGGRSPGVSAMQINDNIIPYIAKEEAKVRIETRKILGKINGDVIKDADIKVSSTCTRVPVIDGHTESVFVETSSDIDPEKAKKMYAEENKNSTVASLPSAPEHYYFCQKNSTFCRSHRCDSTYFSPCKTSFSTRPMHPIPYALCGLDGSA